MMDKLKVIMPKVFVEVVTVLLLVLAVTLLTQIPMLADHGILLGVLAGAEGHDKLRDLVKKLPGVRS